MAKLSNDKWNNARKVWEGDERAGFEWLSIELNLPVSRQAISKRAGKEGWYKGGITKEVEQLQSKVAKPNKATKKVAQPKQLKQKEKTKQKSKNVVKLEVVKKDPWRPTLYKPEYDELAYRFCLLGATDAELGELFDVTEQTINNWKIDNESFFDSLRRGKSIADANVAESVYQRAVGYNYPAEKIFNNMGEILRAEYVEHTPPDIGAAKMWLYNRQRNKWRDRNEADTNIVIGSELMDLIKEQFLPRMEESRRRQEQILIERGIIDIEKVVD